MTVFFVSPSTMAKRITLNKFAKMLYMSSFKTHPLLHNFPIELLHNFTTEVQCPYNKTNCFTPMV